MRVLIFGPAATRVGADFVNVTIEPCGDNASPIDAALVLAAIEAQHPALAFAVAGARLAVNQRFADPSTPVREGDEVALIALVGGG